MYQLARQHPRNRIVRLGMNEVKYAAYKDVDYYIINGLDGCFGITVLGKKGAVVAHLSGMRLHEFLSPVTREIRENYHRLQPIAATLSFTPNQTGAAELMATAINDCANTIIHALTSLGLPTERLEYVSGKEINRSTPPAESGTVVIDATDPNIQVVYLENEKVWTVNKGESRSPEMLSPRIRHISSSPPSGPHKGDQENRDSRHGRRERSQMASRTLHIALSHPTQDQHAPVMQQSMSFQTDVPETDSGRPAWEQRISKGRGTYGGKAGIFFNHGTTLTFLAEGDGLPDHIKGRRGLWYPPNIFIHQTTDNFKHRGEDITVLPRANQAIASRTQAIGSMHRQVADVTRQMSAMTTQPPSVTSNATADSEVWEPWNENSFEPPSLFSRSNPIPGVQRQNTQPRRMESPSAALPSDPEDIMGSYKQVRYWRKVGDKNKKKVFEEGFLNGKRVATSCEAWQKSGSILYCHDHKTWTYTKEVARLPEN